MMDAGRKRKIETRGEVAAGTPVAGTRPPLHACIFLGGMWGDGEKRNL